MSQESKNIPEPLPSPEKVSTNVSLEQFSAIQAHEIKILRGILNEKHAINLILASKVNQLENDKTEEINNLLKDASNERIARLLAISGRERLLTESSEQIDELNKRMSESEFRYARVKSRLDESQIESFMLKKSQAQYAGVIEELQKESAKLSTTLSASRLVISHQKEKITKLKEEVTRLSKPRPIPDIEITADGDIRTTLSSVHIPKKSAREVPRPEEPKLTFLEKALGRMSRFFGRG